MPTLNEYKNEYGYYISAWTTKTGNITYKIREEGYEIVEDLEITDGQECSWDIITSLKSLSLIYTDQSGTIATDEFEPDPKKVSETELSETEARRLYDIIQKHQDLTDVEINRLSEILDIELSSGGFQHLESQLNEKVSYLLETGTIPSRYSLQTGGKEIINVVATTEDLRTQTEKGVVGINITLISELVNSDYTPMVDHAILFARNTESKIGALASTGTTLGTSKAKLLDKKGFCSQPLLNCLKAQILTPVAHLTKLAHPYSILKMQTSNCLEDVNIIRRGAAVCTILFQFDPLT